MRKIQKGDSLPSHCQPSTGMIEYQRSGEIIDVLAEHL